MESIMNIYVEDVMNLTISGRHIEVTPALREYVSSKLERVLRHFDQVVEIQVVLAVDNSKEKDLRQKVSCTLGVKGRDIFVETADVDLYAAIDILMDKLDRQVAKYKEKNKPGKGGESLKYMEENREV